MSELSINTLKGLTSLVQGKLKPQWDITIYLSELLKKRKKKDTEFKILWNDAVTLYRLTGDLVQF